MYSGVQVYGCQFCHGQDPRHIYTSCFFFIFFYEGQKGSNVPFISNQIAEIILKCLLKLRYSQTYGSELSCVTRNKLSEQNEEKLL